MKRLFWTWFLLTASPVVVVFLVTFWLVWYLTSTGDYHVS